MGGFVSLVTRDLQVGPAAALREALEDAGWSSRSTEGLETWTGGPAKPEVVVRDGGVLIGEVFSRAQRPSSSGTRADDPYSWAQRLSEELWGGFVAVRRYDSGVAIYRDPSGVVAAHLVRVGGLTLVASSFAAPGLRPLMTGRRVRRDAVARWLVDPCESATTAALEDVEAPAPGGVLVATAQAVAARAIWNPVAHAGRIADAPTDAASCEARVRGSVLNTAQAYLALGRRLRVEVSGGLDSAVAAAAFGAGGPLRPVHFHASDPEADERRYARSVARRWGAALQEVDLASDLALEELPQFAAAAHVSFNAVDRPYDLAVAEMAQAEAVWGWVTGQGGDAAFLNLRAPALAAGVVARTGWRAPFSLEVVDLAERLRTSVWRVVAAARRTRSRPDPWPSWGPLVGTAGELRDLRSGGSRHPWLQELQTVKPAKRLQLVGLAFALLNNGDSRRSRALRLIHLPLQQPVLEAVLPLPAARLAPAGQDRALLRAAFADALPPAVAARRWKGDLTAVYGRRLTRALPELRPWLLGGELRRLDLLHVAELERLLTPDALFMQARTGDLLKLAAIEGWLRAWR